MRELTKASYQQFKKQAQQDPETFWHEQAYDYITWRKPFDKVLRGDFKNLDLSWFNNGKLNACENALDRHLAKHADKIAYYWESDAGNSKAITYRELHAQVSRFANVLKKFAVQKGDVVCLYLPMIPEAVIAMLACARIGAIHSVVFAGFSPESLKARILDANCKLVITANEGLRGGKMIPLKTNVDAALTNCPQVKNVIVVQHTQQNVPWLKERDHWYHELLPTVAADCPCETMDANDPLFILYTSGSTGKPKGILHSHGGYLVYVAMTFQLIFNYQPQDIYWCTADVGWITGHSYAVYGPLMQAATSILFEGIPNFPTPSRVWEIVDKYKVNIFYTAPTAIRALRHEGDEWVKKTNRNSLKLLGTVGEPINPDVWEWYAQVVGENRCEIVDTWWQTETGGILISPIPNITQLKPGSATFPFFGVEAAVVDDKGNVCAANQMGKLIIKKPWPGMMKTVYKDHQRFVETYFKEFPGNYLTGDNAHVDEDGYFWIKGRSDDVIKISGHRIGTEEVESAFVSHDSVSEAAVVAVPHEIKGESIYAFVNLRAGEKPSDELKKTLINTVRTQIGAIATPEYIQFADALPKTRSGKIMRRVLRKIANKDLENLGDTSTLAEPQVVEELIKNRLELK